MGLVGRELLQFFLNHWGCISSFGLVGYLTGSLVTRKVMAPSFCPNCIRQKAWLEQLRHDAETPDAAKAESRRFYWLRRKRKDKPGEGPKSS